MPLGFAVVVVSLWGLASQADALPANCSQSGQVVTCTFSSTGAEQSFGVPAGVSSVQVTAVGGSGGGYQPPGLPASGGVAAVVSGSLSVAAPQTLYVEVGGLGTVAGCCGGPSAFNGGGLQGDQFAGGGGGASDVRKVSCGSPCVTTNPASLGSRQLIAAGGGGSAAFADILPPAGGSAGMPGGDGPASGTAGGGGGGQAGSASQGGSGGAGGTGPPFNSPGVMGGSGSLGQGGDGGLGGALAGCCNTGGGGGGGLYGGGGGGGGSTNSSGDADGGGGGGGSSLMPPGGSIGLAASNAAPSVTISYTVPPPPGADLAVALSVLPGQVHFGSPVIYTATVTNHGPSAASSVQLQDTLPVGVRSLLITHPAGWSCTTPPVLSSGTITCTSASLASGATARFHLAVVNLEHRGGFLRDTATVSATTTDPNPANNQATITTKVS